MPLLSSLALKLAASFKKRRALSVVLSLLIAAQGVIIWFKYSTHWERTTDLIQDYAAGIAVRSGLPIYGESLSEIARTIVPGSKIENFHPPFLALLFAPLSQLPFPVVLFLSNLLTLILYILIVNRTIRSLGVREPLPFVALALLWFPFQTGIASGQFSSLVIATLVLTGWSLLSRERQAAAGFLIGLAALIKLFPLLYLLPLILLGKIRSAAVMGVTIAVGWTLSGLLLGGDVHHYFAEIAPRDIREWAGYPTNASIAGLIYPLSTNNGWVTPLFDSRPIGEGVILALSLSLVALLCITIRRRSTDLQSAFALTTIAMMLLSPITWVHIFPLLLPIIATLWQRSRPSYIPLIATVACLSIPDLHLMNALMRWMSPRKLPAIVFIAAKLPTIGLLALWLQALRVTGLSRERN